MKLRALALAALLAACAAAHAWSATGHMVVAAIARADLTPAVRTEVDRLLKIEADRPGSDDFVTVAAWADDVRSERKETGPWHFKDLYFRDDGKPAANKPDEVNVVAKIREFTAVLGDKTKADAQRAEALRFLIHFVGDVHQPLHATSRETDAHPMGDRGGNDFAILPPPDSGERGPKNLHSLWDGGAGLFPYVPRDEMKAVASAEALAIRATVPRLSLANESEEDPDQWAVESFDAARNIAYKTPEGAVPSPQYLVDAQALAARRVALAGYRLADLLDRVLGSAP